MNIRKIKIKDNPQVEQLIKEVMTEYGCTGCGFSIEDDEVSSMYEAYDKEKHIFYVIEDDFGKILGCGGIGKLENGEQGQSELKKMYFYPELRGKGLGTKLMKKLLDFARNHFNEVYLETMDNMQEAQKVYQKFGFKFLNEKRGDTGHFKCNTYMSLKFSNDKINLV